MLAISRAIDFMNTWIGKIASFAILFAILISATNATTRYFFDIASNYWLDRQWHLFSLAFLMCGPWVLMLNEHIRIDILNSKFKPSTRSWIDIIGHLFILIPFCLMMIYTSIPSAYRSWTLNEQSTNYGGAAQWEPKLLIPIAFCLLLLQAISEIIKRFAVLHGKIPDPYRESSAHSPEVAILEDPAGE